MVRSHPLAAVMAMEMVLAILQAVSMSCVVKNFECKLSIISSNISTLRCGPKAAFGLCAGWFFAHSPCLRAFWFLAGAPPAFPRGLLVCFGFFFGFCFVVIGCP